MGGGGGKGGTTVQQTTIPPEVLARYNAVNARAEDVAATPFQRYGGQFVAGLTPEQNTGIQNVMNTQGMTDPFYGASAGMTLGAAQPVGPLSQNQIGYYQNPFTQAVAAPTFQALQQQQGQERSALAGKQIMSGAFGGDRAGLERANLSRQQTLGTAQALAPIYQQGYNTAVQTAQGQQGIIGQDLNRQLQAGAQIGALGTSAQQSALQSAQAQMAAGTLPQQTQQADLTANYQQFLQERGYPFQVSQFLANIATGTGALSGSTTQTGQPSAFFSDEREKTNIKSLGDGLYAYDYKDDVKRAKKNGEPMGPKRVGPMAQDIEKNAPGLVMDVNDHKIVTPQNDNSLGGAVLRAGDFARGGYAGGSSVYEPIDFGSILAAQQGFLPGMGQKGQKPIGLAIPSEKIGGGKTISPHTPPPKREPTINAEKAVSGALKGYELYKDPKFSPWKDAKEALGFGDKTASTQVTNNPANGTSTATRVAPTNNPNVGVKTQQRADIPSERATPVAFKGSGDNVPPDVAAAQAILRERIQNREQAQAQAQAQQQPQPEAPQPPLNAIRQNDQAFTRVAGGPEDQSLGDAAKNLTDGMDQPLGQLAMLNASFDTGSDFGGGGGGEFFGDGGGGGGFGGDFGTFAAKRGGVVPRGHYAGKGFVTPGYDPEVNPNDIMDTTVENGQQDTASLKAEQKSLEHQAPKESKDNTGSSIGSLIGAGIGTMFMPGAGTMLGSMAGGLAGSMFREGGLVREHHAGNDGNVVDPDRAAIIDSIRQGAEAEGAPELTDYLTKAAGAESSFNPRAVNPNTKATGLLQIKPDTYSWAGGEGDATDPVNNARAGAKLTKWNREQLQKYGHEPTEGNTYLAHFLGHRGAKWALDNPDRPLAETHPGWEKVAAANNIPGIADWTGKDAADWADAKINGKAPPEGSRRPGVKQTDYSGSSPQFASLGDVARSVLPESVPTSENFWVPTLSFLGGMLASPSPKLLGAVGSGLVSGVQGYSGLRQQQQEDIKNIMSIVDKQYKRSYNEDTGEFEFTDRFGAKVSPSDAQVGVARLILGQGLDPRTYGIPAEAVAKAKSLMSGTAKTADASTKVATDLAKTINAPAAKTTTQPQEGVVKEQPTVAPVPTEEELLNMSKLEQIKTITSNPELRKQYGLKDSDDIVAMDGQMQKLQRAIKVYGDSGDSAAQDAAVKRYEILKQKRDQTIERATNILTSKSEQYAKDTMKSLDDFDSKRAERSNTFDSERSRMIQLSSILSQTATGNPKQFMGLLSQWLKEAGVPTDAIKDAENAGLDQITKLVNDRIYATMTAQNLIRAPASVATGLSKTQPNVAAVPGATKPLVARILAEMEISRERDQAYASGKDPVTGKPYYGTNPRRFEERYNNQSDQQKKLDTKIAKYLTELPDPKGVTPEDKKNWYTTWGQYGYDPTVAVQSRAGQSAAPVSGQTSTGVPFSTDVPFKVVQ